MGVGLEKKSEEGTARRGRGESGNVLGRWGSCGCIMGTKGPAQGLAHSRKSLYPFAHS